MKHKRIRLAAALLLALLTFSACQETRTHSPHVHIDYPTVARTGDGLIPVETVLHDVSLLVDTVQAHYPDKKVLVWLYEGDNAPFPVSKNCAVNEYLETQNVGYSLVLYPVPLFNSGTTYEYANKLEQYFQMNGVCDIFSVGIIKDYSSNQPSRNFRYYLDKGLFLPISSYVRGGAGKALLNLLGEEYCKAMEVNGEIYGVSPSATLFNAVGPHFLVHEDAWEYLNHDALSAGAIEALFWDEGQLLALQTALGGRTPLSFGQMHSTNLLDPLFYQGRYLRIGTLPLYWDTGADRPTVVPLWEMERFINYQAHLEALQTKGLVTAESGVIDAWIHLVHGYSAKQTEATMENNRLLIVPADSYGWTVSGGSFFGISAASKHPNEAFDLINRVMTDPALNNLLCFGVENQDYSLVDGKVVMGGGKRQYTAEFGNALLFTTPRNMFSIESNEHFYKLRDNTVCLPYTNTVVDLSVFEEEAAALLAWQNSGLDFFRKGASKTRFDAWIARAPALSPAFIEYLENSIQPKN